MIVKAARLWRHEIAGLPALAVVEYADRIDLGAVRVIGVRVRRHVMSSRILVDEQHARSDRNGEFLRTHTACRQREGVGIGWSGRRSWRRAASSTARSEEQTEDENKNRHRPRLSGAGHVNGNRGSGEDRVR